MTNPRPAPPNLICLWTDRLHIGYLGAYGNSWVQTPYFDALAAESVLFDRYFTSSLDLVPLCRAFWEGKDPLSPEPAAGANLPPAPKKHGLIGQLWKKGKALPRARLLAELENAGYRTVFLTDDAAAAALAEEAGFSKTVLLPAAGAVAGSLEETAFYTAMTRAASAAERLARSKHPFFLWIHLKGWGGVWDFPTEARIRACEDDDDPPPYDAAEPPFFREGKEFDFDLQRAVAETYAAGISVWDSSLGELTARLADSGVLENSAFFLGSLRGFPHGEHRRVGVSPEEPGLLYFEEIHLPLLYRPAGDGNEAVRTFGLCGPDDLFGALLRLAGSPQDRGTLLELASEETEAIRSFLSVTQSDSGSRRQGVVTDQWYYLRDRTGTLPKRELYLCPNDRWNVNEVADRVGDEILGELDRKIGSGGFARFI